MSLSDGMLLGDALDAATRQRYEAVLRRVKARSTHGGSPGSLTIYAPAGACSGRLRMCYYRPDYRTWRAVGVLCSACKVLWVDPVRALTDE